MPKQLAITISGAVSLGSYESGVVYEVLHALAQHNRWAEENKLPDERIEIDVLTGASAGGMTAAMVAQRLLYDGAAMEQAYNNPLYNAWVQEVDIVGLLARSPDEDVAHSVLSSDLVIRISNKYLMGRYTDQPQPPGPAEPHPALAADGTLQLGLALSNLNGIDYSRSTLSGSQFIYTRHEDQFVRGIAQVADDRRKCGARFAAWRWRAAHFPAFRVQDLVRNIVEYTSPWLVRSLWCGLPSTTFTYTDGGVFQNQPLGMAKNLVENVPGGRLNATDRGYLFIAPKQTSSESDKNCGEPGNGSSVDATFNAKNADYKALLSSLAESVVGQSQFQDWSAAEGYNDKILLLDERADQLQTLFLTGVLTPAATAAVSSALLHSMFAENRVMTQAAVAQLDTARHSISLCRIRHHGFILLTT